MTLLVQVALVLGATAAVGLLLRRPREGWWRQSYVVVVAVVILMAASFDDASNQFRSMATQTRNDAKVSRENAEKAGWLGEPLLGNFVEWLRDELPSDARFHLIMDPKAPGELYQWTTYRLLPRVETKPRSTEWLVFAGTTPREAGVKSLPLTEARVFAPRLSIARIAR
jgi:hypothetical protein